MKNVLHERRIVILTASMLAGALAMGGPPVRLLADDAPEREVTKVGSEEIQNITSKPVRSIKGSAPQAILGGVQALPSLGVRRLRGGATVYAEDGSPVVSGTSGAVLNNSAPRPTERTALPNSGEAAETAPSTVSGQVNTSGAQAGSESPQEAPASNAVQTDSPPGRIVFNEKTTNIRSVPVEAEAPPAVRRTRAVPQQRQATRSERRVEREARPSQEAEPIVPDGDRIPWPSSAMKPLEEHQREVEAYRARSKEMERQKLRQDKEEELRRLREKQNK